MYLPADLLYDDADFIRIFVSDLNSVYVVKTNYNSFFTKHFRYMLGYLVVNRDTKCPSLKQKQGPYE